MQPTIAFLATGDEIIEGDVINTSTPSIAKLLKPLGVQFGAQMACDDNQNHIETALRNLLQNHAAIIITGGLGPTCDDRTRFAVANITGKTLKLDKESWDRVYQYIYHLRGFVPENNKQQCLFPEGSTILKNDHGTADGCHITIKADNPDRVHTDYQHIFMLPGPPSQALPIVTQAIVPFFTNTPFAKKTYRHSWMLLSTSESHIAQQIEHALGDNHIGIQIGYRYAPPYLQVKLIADNQHHYDEAYRIILPILQSHIWREGNQDAIEILSDYIIASGKQWHFEDGLTQGRLNTALTQLASLNLMTFSSTIKHAKPDFTVKLSGDLEAALQACQSGEKKQALSWQLSLSTPEGTYAHAYESSLLLNDHYFETLSQCVAIELVQQIIQPKESST